VKKMREIKFRVWDIEFCEMCYSNEANLFFDEDSGCASEFEGLRPSGGGAVLDEGEFELMQYTGLKDAEGNEIYEGDIVADYSADVGLELSKVIWNIEMAAFWLEKWGESLEEIGDAKVVGNIYENPELMEQE
jgi:uncharacterized phage protein (TIGR01671 family)